LNTFALLAVAEAVLKYLVLLLEAAAEVEY
jgi:hypothetical protein